MSMYACMKTARLQLGTNSRKHMYVRVACVCLCVLYDDGSAGLEGLNGCRGRGCHHPSNAAQAAHCLLRGERHKIEGSERGRAQMLLLG